MVEVVVVSSLIVLTLLGGVIVPVLMGAFLWIERREHRIRMAGLSPGDRWIRQRLVEINSERIARFAPRHLQWSDLIGVWPIVSIAFVLLIPLATWTDPYRDDLLLAIHPVVCVGWWLNMRSRGIIRAEVYALSTWVLAYVAWTLSILAPFGQWIWGFERIKGDFASYVAGGLGISSEFALTLWLLHSAFGIACVSAGIVLARRDRPTVSPLLVVALWIPFVWGTLNTNLWFVFLGLVVSVGVAGWGISREVRRIQDDADMRFGPAERKPSATLRSPASAGLVLRTVAVIVISVAIWVVARESVISSPVAYVAATWAALSLAPLASALLAHLDSRPRVASAWAAWAWMATASVLALYHMVGPSSLLFSGLTRGYGSTYPDPSFDLIIHPQAIAVWIVAVALSLVAYRKSLLMSYGAFLLGLLWFPIATFASSLHIGASQAYAVPDSVGYASMVAMGCIILAIMWRFFGPGATAAVVARQSAAVPADAPGARADAGYPTRVHQPHGNQPEVIPTPQRSPDSEFRA